MQSTSVFSRSKHPLKTFPHHANRLSLHMIWNIDFLISMVNVISFCLRSREQNVAYVFLTNVAMFFFYVDILIFDKRS